MALQYWLAEEQLICMKDGKSIACLEGSDLDRQTSKEWAKHSVGYSVANGTDKMQEMARKGFCATLREISL